MLPNSMSDVWLLLADCVEELGVCERQYDIAEQSIARSIQGDRLAGA